MIVSSPATVPATPGSAASSMRRATRLAVPGGVLITATGETTSTESTSSRTPIAGARADEAKLLDVARDGRLRCLKPAPRQRFGDLLLRMDRAAVDDVEDRAVPGAFGRGHFAISSMVFCARSIWSGVMMSGGTKRIVLSSTALTTSLASRQAC